MFKFSRWPNGCTAESESNQARFDCPTTQCRLQENGKNNMILVQMLGAKLVFNANFLYL